MSMSEGTLEDYFRIRTPPSRGAEIIRFWEALFDLLGELKGCHTSGSAHLNIAPERIHSVEDGQDGHSRWGLDFRNSDSNITGRKPSQYDPPELSMSPELSSHMSWTTDIWSLGCIYSEAAIWLTDGYSGLQEYRYQRQTEASSVFPISNHSKTCPFHNGIEVMKCVQNAHIDIEARLRRSDHITKNVLETMVQEMLWEEDRPSTKALLRKADVVLLRARQKVGVDSESGNRSGIVSQGSRHRREYPPPAFPSPTQPLPPLPKRAVPTLKSVSRADSATITEREQMSQRSERDSTIQLRIAHMSPNVPHRPAPNQGRPRTLPKQDSSDPRSKSTHDQVNTSTREPHATPFILPTLNNFHPVTQTYAPDVSASHSEIAPSCIKPEDILPARPPSYSRSHQSSTYSQPLSSSTGQDDSFLDALSYVPTVEETRPEFKLPKRGIGFSLFPSRSRHEASPKQSRINVPSIPRTPSLISDDAPNLEYISLNTCLEWKKANKKVKKQANIPPLLSVTMMEELGERDHAFIIDDSASMAPVWLDVQRVFEALSYLVKGMSPEGTELFFTVSCTPPQ
ncbi:hypothetical protein ONS95_006339 [Cadophora gregata]|uniref:uncharacterized protein n=1 Tax=Cadophora gregata TaxID=51156 RepID=UPI0026DCF015|nr:uncharacterized protein ONS95_006339 [Cadophora gregata]KAK0102741.1 hypothetical protein ONS95_006339 [Cadophora gregata]